MPVSALEVAFFVRRAHAAQRALGLAERRLGDLAVPLAVQRGQSESESVAAVQVPDRGVFYSADQRDIHE